MDKGLIYALGVLSGGVGIALLFELLALLDEQAPSISASVRRLGATGAAINPEAQDTVTAAVVPPRSSLETSLVVDESAHDAVTGGSLDPSRRSFYRSSKHGR